MGDIISTGVLLVCLCILAVHFWEQYIVGLKDNASKLPLPPGTVGWPIIGETIQLVKQGFDFYRERLNTYGRVYKTHILGRPTIRVSGIENVKKILRGENVLVTSQWPSSVRQLIGDHSLVQSVGTVHAVRRKAISKAFNNQSLSEYIFGQQHIVRKFIDKWSSQESILGFMECRKVAFAIASEVLLGLHLEEREQETLLNTFTDFENSLFSLPVAVPGMGLHRGLAARKKIMSLIENRIKQRLQDTNQNEHKIDVLSLLIAAEDDSSYKLSLDELMDTALEFLFAGHESTASGLCSILYHLGKSPDVLTKLMEELDEHGLLANSDENLTLEMVNKLSYVNHVVKEILRIVPPVGAGYRKVLQTFEIEGYQIPKGWTVVYSIRETQEAAGTTFDPSRWEKSSDTPFIPFGSGRRSCIGKDFAKLVLKVFCVEITRRCSWKLACNEPVFKYLPVPHPANDISISVNGKVQTRKQCNLAQG